MHIAIVTIFAFLTESLVGCKHLHSWLSKCIAQYVVNSSCQTASSHCSLSYDFLERAQSIIKSTLTATTGEGEASLERPSTFIISILERRDNRCKSLALECTRSNRIVHIVCEQCIIILNATCLVSQLPVDGKMLSFTHEYNSCWIVINTVDTNRSLTAHHSVECYMLIGVSEQTTCKRRGC